MIDQRTAFPTRHRSTVKATVRRLALVVAALIVIVFLLGAFLLRSVPPTKPRLSARIERGSLHHGGRERTFLFYVPARVEPSPALLLVFHPSMSSGAGAREAFAYEFDRLADEHGFIAVYPDGVGQHWNDCRKRAPYAARRLGIDDTGFARTLVAHFVASRGVAAERIFVTGVSNGGSMAIRLALEAPDLVRAVAAVAASVPAEQNLGCRVSGLPVSILFMNGTADPMNPYDGGDVVLYGVWGNRGPVLSAVDSARLFATLAGYRGEPKREVVADRDRSDGSTVERLRWSEPGRRSIILDSVRGGGHTVPHSTVRGPRLLGRTNGDLTAAEEIWSFFSSETDGVIETAKEKE
jgi:polyhydroxybutyrate depolymerase